MKRWAYFGIGVAATAAVLLAGALAPEPPQPTMIAGTIRWVDAKRWTVLEDRGHIPTGIVSAVPRGDRVRVTYAECAATVGALQVTPDEQFAAAGVRVGASVGLCYADLFFYMGASQTPVNPALLSRKGGNIWISGVMHPTEQEAEGQ